MDLDIKSETFSKLDKASNSKDSGYSKEMKPFHTTEGNKLIISFDTQIPEAWS